MKKCLIIGLFFGVLAVPAVSFGITADELRAQANTLLQQVQSLQNQLPQSDYGCFDFKANVKIGDNGAKVKNLQTVLEKEGFEISSDEREDSTFGESTASAVTGFQEKYKEEVLTPSKLKNGTGFAGKATRAKLNKVYGCGSSDDSEAKLTTEASFKIIIAPKSDYLENGKTYELVAKIRNAPKNFPVYFNLVRPDGTMKYNNHLVIYTNASGNATVTHKATLKNAQTGTWQAIVVVGDWKSNVVKINVGANIPPSVCGDSICSSNETCSTCPTDCGICPPTTPSLIINKSPIIIPQNILAGGMRQILGGFTAEAGKNPVVVNHANFYVSVTGSGGQAYNITSIVLLDENNITIAGPVNIVVGDKTNKISFSDNFVIPVAKKNYVIKGDVSPVFNNDQTITLSTTPSNDWMITDQITGFSLIASPSYPVYSNTMTIGGPSLSVSLDPSTPVATIQPAGSINVTATVLKFFAAIDAIDLKRLALQFDGSEVSNVTKITVWDGATKIGESFFPGAATTTTINFPSSVIIPKDSSKILTIKVDILPTAKNGDTIAINYDANGQAGNTYGIVLSSGATITPITKTDTVASKITIGTTTTSSITVLSPNGGEKWEIGKTQIIRWQHAKQFAGKTIFYSVQLLGDISQGQIGSTLIQEGKVSMSIYSPSNGEIVWTIPANIIPGQYRIYVSEQDIYNSSIREEDYSDAPFSIVASSIPSITVLSPNGGEKWEIGKSYEIRWLASNINFLSENVRSAGINIYYKSTDSKIIKRITNVPTYEGVGSYLWKLPDLQLEGKQYYLEINFGDTENYDYSDAPFSIVVTVTTLPDLIVTDIKIDPANPITGQNAVFTAGVKNIGNVVANDIQFTTDFGNTPISNTSNYSTGALRCVNGISLSPGSSCLIAFNVKYATSSLSNKITVTADMSNKIIESDENNNVSSISFQILLATTTSSLNQMASVLESVRKTLEGIIEILKK